MTKANKFLSAEEITAAKINPDGSQGVVNTYGFQYFLHHEIFKAEDQQDFDVFAEAFKTFWYQDEAQALARYSSNAPLCAYLKLAIRHLERRDMLNEQQRQQDRLDAEVSGRFMNYRC